jgi:hypothetical protein
MAPGLVEPSGLMFSGFVVIQILLGPRRKLLQAWPPSGSELFVCCAPTKD